MLRSRIIPCLLIRDNGLVKTKQFQDYKYIGDPVNTVRIFNEKEVDELMVLDIDATVKGRKPDYALIKKIAAECRMPLCYGGGIKTAEQAKDIISLGVEKVSVSSGAVENINLISEIAETVGTQSISVVLDTKSARLTGKRSIFTHNATKKTSLDPVKFATELQAKGAGEIILYSIDNDGMKKGYDLKLAKQVRSAIDIPLSVMGGVGTVQDMQTLIDEVGVVGAGAGSLFVFKGVYDAVLVNYARP